jgi:hypothetical protein
MDQPIVPVVMCTWKRIDRLPKTIEMLGQQKSCQPKLYLWNNCSEEAARVEEIAKNARNLHVRVKQSPQNIGGFGRFYWARELSEQSPLVVFIDDDEEFDEETVGTFAREFELKTLKGYWGFHLLGTSDYWDRSWVPAGKEITYCGTGGMVADSLIFREPGLYDCPEQYWFFDDLWLSYFANYVMGWQMYKSQAELQIIDDDKNYGPGKEEAKSEFFRYLCSLGWKPA